MQLRVRLLGEVGVVRPRAAGGSPRARRPPPAGRAAYSRMVSSMATRMSPSGVSVTVTRLTSSEVGDRVQAAVLPAGVVEGRRTRRRRGRSRRRRRPAGGTPAAGRRSAGRGSRRSCRAASAAGWAGPGRSRRGRGSRRGGPAAPWATSSLTRAAASSMASGSPSSRRQIAATSPALSASGEAGAHQRGLLDEEPDRAERGDLLQRRAGAVRPAGGTGYSCSPCRCSGRREVAITTSSGAPGEQGGDDRRRRPRAARGCRAPAGRTRSASSSGTARSRPTSELTPSTSASAFHITSAVVTVASGTK